MSGARMYRNLVEWTLTCDRCGQTESGTTEIPAGAPLGPPASPTRWFELEQIDHGAVFNGQKWDLCPACRDEFRAFMTIPTLLTHDPACPGCAECDEFIRGSL